MFYEYYVKKIKEVVMKIKLDSVKGFYQKGKNAAKEAVKDAKNQFEEKVSPKIEESFEKAADWTDKRIFESKEMYETARRNAEPKVKEVYEAVRQKAEPKVREAIAYAQFAIKPPKTEVLAKKAADAQKKYFQKELYVKSLHKNFPNQTNLILAHEKELASLNQKAQTAIKKYNDFAAKEIQAQEAFKNLNYINK